MSPPHRNVKINQGGWCWQCRRSICTSFHFAYRGALLAGGIYQRLEFYWCLSAFISLSLAFVHGAYCLLLSVLSHSFCSSWFLEGYLRSCKVLAWWGGTTKVQIELVVPEADGMLASILKWWTVKGFKIFTCLFLCQICCNFT